jgi:protoheme IX farnesyltransferase
LYFERTAMTTGGRAVAKARRRRLLSEFAVRVARHLSLAKLPLCYLMTASALTAYVARRPVLDSTAWQTISGLFLLCLGSATLNNYQDRDIDTRMRRTRRRPLARGQISSRAALVQAAALILAGTVGLVLASDSLALPLAGLYTPLKRTTVLAIIPGAVCGMLPVLMGWMAAGGGLGSPKLWILMIVFGVWQLPHFWLVVLAHREDYRNSGIPSMLGILSTGQLRQLVFVWAAAFVLLTLCLPLYRVILSETASWILLANALALATFFGICLRGDRDRYRALFRYLSLSLAVVMSVILVDGIVLSYLSRV